MFPLLSFVLGGLPSYPVAQDGPGVDLLANGSFDTDANHDGWPDAWFDYHGAHITDGGRGGSKCLELSSKDSNLRARCQQGFPVDGQTVRWVEVAAWARGTGAQPGECEADVPSIRLSLFRASEEAELLEVIRLPLSPFEWCRFARVVRVPRDITHALFTPTLGGARGTLRVDGALVREVGDPYVGGPELLRNPSFEWGGAVPDHWRAAGAYRSSPGCPDDVALHIADGWIEQDVLLPKGAVQLSLAMWLRSEARAHPAVGVALYDEWGRQGPDPRQAARHFEVDCRPEWTPWESERIRVPDWAVVATLRIECSALGCELDDVSVQAHDRDANLLLRPAAYAPATDGWPVYAGREPGADAGQATARLLPVRVENGHFVTPSGNRLRFWGAQLSGADCFPTEEEALSLCRNLQVRGFNLVVFRDLCWPSRTGQSLVPPYARDTLSLHQPALRRLDRLCALLPRHGIYYALELGGGRRFREDDSVTAHGQLPPGGGPAAYFDGRLIELQRRHAIDLLRHRNRETGLQYADDPALAWVAVTRSDPPLALVDPVSDPPPLPEPYALDLERRFRAWLLQHHGSERELREAWRTDDLQTLIAEAVRGVEPGVDVPSRDTIAFLHHVQVEFGGQMTRALRDAGFGGPISSGLQYLGLPADLEARARSGLVELLTGDLPRPAAGPFVASSLCFPGQDAASLAAARQVSGLPTVVTNAGAATPSEEASSLLLLSAVGSALDWDGLVAARIAPTVSPWGTRRVWGLQGPMARDRSVPTNSHPLLVELLPLARTCFLSGHAVSRPAVVPVAPTDLPPLTAGARQPRPVSGALVSPAELSFEDLGAPIPLPVAPGRAKQPITLGDLTWDWARGRWTVAGQETALLGGVMRGSLLPVGPFLVSIDPGFAVFTAVSRDGLPIGESRLIHLSLLGWSEAEDALYTDRALRYLLSAGRPPMHLAPVRAHVSLQRTRRVPRLRAHRLDWEGQRVGSLQTMQRTGSVSLELPAQGHYELSAD